ncbi:MAG: hypothetical protein Q611_LSC00075G0002, partial [Leuconostoc sp. DORA_2]
KANCGKIGYMIFLTKNSQKVNMGNIEVTCEKAV